MTRKVSASPHHGARSGKEGADMAGESITFSELFRQQEAASKGLRFTAQPVADDSERFKITPVDGDGNCWCASALVIPVAIRYHAQDDRSHGCVSR